VKTPPSHASLAHRALHRRKKKPSTPSNKFGSTYEKIFLFTCYHDGVVEILGILWCADRFMSLIGNKRVHIEIQLMGFWLPPWFRRLYLYWVDKTILFYCAQAPVFFGQKVTGESSRKKRDLSKKPSEECWASRRQLELKQKKLLTKQRRKSVLIRLIN